MWTATPLDGPCVVTNWSNTLDILQAARQRVWKRRTSNVYPTGRFRGGFVIASYLMLTMSPPLDTMDPLISSASFLLRPRDIADGFAQVSTQENVSLPGRRPSTAYHRLHNLHTIIGWSSPGVFAGIAPSFHLNAIIVGPRPLVPQAPSPSALSVLQMRAPSNGGLHPPVTPALTTITPSVPQTSPLSYPTPTAANGQPSPTLAFLFNESDELPTSSTPTPTGPKPPISQRELHMSLTLV